ncbi:hypothetical protein Riv7116_4333 [Rivularia sp. PCC 7116]|uniref:hypothetical protein n=1 Tax=Rivularia sp. PCC 7116 TaxID=373994 RepID=UPI00029EFA42|nr:hypothetical protein [Rivularia sp. PCC 7116]AFY56761.1 hypothetical protein Riv7116_4333 [Rivularia sp. PCC 7116]
MKPDFTPNSSFQVLDDILAQQVVSPFSLNPNQLFITSFAQLEVKVVRQVSDSYLVTIIYDTLHKVLDALLHNFPENIFWDFDFIVSSLVQLALSAEEKVEILKDFGNKIVSLMGMFGKESEIRFRYVHDFMYGFDWARWVKKKPNYRANSDPFCIHFIDHLLIKGEEILHSIKTNDAKYPQISGKRYRNPFCFSREPQDEYRLLNYLAACKCIPVAAWEWNTVGVWDKPFYQLREDASQKLNLAKK